MADTTELNTVQGSIPNSSASSNARPSNYSTESLLELHHSLETAAQIQREPTNGDEIIHRLRDLNNLARLHRSALATYCPSSREAGQVEIERLEESDGCSRPMVTRSLIRLGSFEIDDEQDERGIWLLVLRDSLSSIHAAVTVLQRASEQPGACPTEVQKNEVDSLVADIRAVLGETMTRVSMSHFAVSTCRIPRNARPRGQQ